jgi:hypothetical protein
MRFHPVQLAALCAIAFVGCKKDEVQVYQAPKDAAAPAPTAAASPGSDAGSEAAGQRPPWTVPEGWTKKEASGMRIASYSVTAADGRSADVSVVPLGPAAGTELENVNRWRKELKLADITEADLAGQTQAVPIGSLPSKMYEMVSDTTVLDEKHKARTLAAVLSVSGTTVFFKMKGEDVLVAENKPKFLAWLKSVDTGEPSPSSAQAAAPAPSAAPPADMRGPVTPPPSTGQPHWDVPAGWKPAAASTRRIASFVVGDGGDMSVVALGPAAGGTLANVNRWRGQLGLASVAEDALGTIEIDIAGGGKAVVADLTGEGSGAGKKMLAAIVSRPDRTWFYKLAGPAALVAKERENFIGFVKSVKY